MLLKRGNSEVLLDNVLIATSSMEQDLDQWLEHERAFIKSTILQMQSSSSHAWQDPVRQVLGTLADIVPNIIFAVSSFAGYISIVN